MNTKKFIFDENKPPIFYRPGTSDESIIQTVLVEQKEYLFPNFKPKIIYDIGANIGVVSVIMSMIYPDARIHSFEPEPNNFDLLEMNTAHLPNVTRHKFGLGNLTRTEELFASDDPTNLGGFSTRIEGGEPHSPVHFIDVKSVSEMVAVTGNPDLIKTDCEGAEYDILSSISTNVLKEVKWITGELHGVRDYELLELLSESHLIQTARCFGDKVWHFNALAKTWTDFGKTQDTKTD